jgi:hypothetical protein
VPKREMPVDVHSHTDIYGWWRGEEESGLRVGSTIVCGGAEGGGEAGGAAAGGRARGRGVLTNDNTAHRCRRNVIRSIQPNDGDDADDRAREEQ